MKDLEATHGRYGERKRTAGASRPRSLLPFVVLTLETGARKNTVRTLQRKNIDFDARCLRFGKDKINAGIPLPKAAKIVGWSPSTMVKMAARYGHFTTDDLRESDGNNFDRVPGILPGTHR